MDANLERLRSIKTFPSLVKYLKEELDWPIEPADVEDLTFEYEAEELGLDAKTAAKIKEIKQLRPFVTGQPWGIFYINFEPKQLPIVALRRILSKLVLKKRASGNKSEQASWQLNDLLFISSYGDSDERTISFAHFSEDKQFGDLPTLRVLGWDSQDTVLRLEDVEQTLSNKLRWPEDENNVEDWRKAWSSAFTLRHREVVKTSKELAVKLADLAIVIRRRANKVLSIESDKGPMRKLYKAFQEALIHDLDEDDFADMYAQTIAYGLLTARVSRPSGLVVENVTDMVPITNPFLKELLQTFLTVGGRKGKIDFDELGINEVVELLRIANMEAVLKDFGDRNPLEDPVIHFYELFLKEYDPQKRMKRGVFYTPRPVVSFIVRSVDEILRKEFRLEDGFADTTTWGEMVKRIEGLTIPQGVHKDEPFVQILDPATGTGTFLVEVINRIYETLRAKWTSEKKNALEMDELWNEYVPRHLLPRLHGFELMMAPYAIAHMKIGLKLRETHYSFLSSERARIYLTNTLEEPREFSGYLEQMAPALAHEAEAANKIKRGTRITVVIGNPPYSQAAGRGAYTPSRAFERYRSHVSTERRSGPLSNDYVRFFAWSQEAVETAGAGVVGMITSSSFLQSIVHRGMRYEMLASFEPLFSLDLHGESLPGRGRESGSSKGPTNVFDIQEGVVITVGVRKPAGGTQEHLKRFELTGSRADKYQRLLKDSIYENEWLEFRPSKKSGWLFSNLGADTVETVPGISFKEIFSQQTTGITTYRDHFVVAFTQRELEKRVDQTQEMVKDAVGFAKKFDLEDGRGLTISSFLSAVSRTRDPRKEIRGYLFSPFDRRFIWYRTDLLGAARADVTRHLLRPNLSMLTTRQSKEEFGVFATRLLPGHKVIAKYEGTYFAPLFIQPVDNGPQVEFLGMPQRHNFSSGFLKDLARTLSCAQSGAELPNELAAEEIFHYIYAILHSPIYRTRYADFLRIDYPKVPLTTDVKLFGRLSAVGADLVAMHVLEEDYKFASWNTSQPKGNPLKTLITRFYGKGEAEVAKGYPKYADGNVYINPSRYFKGVPEEVWKFHIGGYQVCDKWLKDRRGRMLSDEDINHYQRVVVALSETIRLMAEIDRVIEEHGGWPLARAEDAVVLRGERLREQAERIPLPAQIRYPQPDHAVYMMRVILSMLQQSGGSINIDRLMNACTLLAMPDTLETHGAIIEADLAHEWRSRFSDHFNPDVFLSKVDDLVQRGEIRLLRVGSGFQMVRVRTSELPTDAHIEFDAWFALRVADSLIQTEREVFPPLATREQIEERSSAA